MCEQHLYATAAKNSIALYAAGIYGYEWAIYFVVRKFCR